MCEARSDTNKIAPGVKLPEWLQRPPGSSAEAREVKRLLRRSSLNTVCEEARCPNISECFSRRTATFMILGDVCTRSCRFCSTRTGRPSFPPAQFLSEAARVADAAKALELRHVVVTSVTRDDLEDGGAEAFYLTISALREKAPGVTVEVLVPDFRGSAQAVRRVAEAAPEVFNHNLETVKRLYRRVRPGASYERSLEVLAQAASLMPKALTKTGIMLGLGEAENEVLALMHDARAAGVGMFTGGQYLQPTRSHLPVAEYLPPASFAGYREHAVAVGFERVAIGPLVRSSYNACA